MICGVLRFSPFNLTLRPANRILAALHVRFRAHDLRIQFRNFKNRQHLSRLHVVAYIHKDLSDIARHLRVNIHFLIRPEGARKSQRIYQRTPLDQSHCHWAKRRFLSLIGLGFFSRCPKENHQADCNNR